MVAHVLTRACLGTEAPQVVVEVFAARGLPSVSIVGLAEGALRESKDRVRAAIANSGFQFPAGRVLVSLGPADLPKEGGRYDLPIALGILAASRQIPSASLHSWEFYGELSLDGTLKPGRGLLPAICQAVKARHGVVMPRENLPEAALVAGAKVAGASHLSEVCAHLRGCRPLSLEVCSGLSIPATCDRQPDLADMKGQPLARRALEVAAAGAHSLLLVGPPGIGKSMLAHRLPGILPPMTGAEAMETAAIASLTVNGFNVGDWGRRPFRVVHHLSPALALVGGGAHPRPGEVTLAHNGTLFLDELSLFETGTLEALREPLESGVVCISRTARQTVFPARFQLIAAMNNCPCGASGDGARYCRCSENELRRYRSRLSGPLLDRLDMHVRMTRLSAESLDGSAPRAESSSIVACRVANARARQAARQKECNAYLTADETERFCMPDAEGQAILAKLIGTLGASARAYHRILRVARTLADLDQADAVSGVHVAEALMFRQMDQRSAFDFISKDRSYSNDALLKLVSS